MEDLNQELTISKVREKLNADKIKLWLPPYTSATQERRELPVDLVRRYATELDLSEEIVAEALENLRSHALEKLAERSRFQTKGIATLKIKVASEHDKRTITIEISLDKKGADLKQIVADKIEVDRACIKLISAGRVICNDSSLQSQNIKSGGQVMAVILTGTEAEILKHEQDVSEVFKTREAAELLSLRAEEDDDTFDVQIADQKGRPLDLPKAEKKSLTLAMTLHEKGRRALNEKNYSRALLLLLEADKEFANCRAEILDIVDNYAILCLDIVWCYLCLENIRELPDAERRLKKCEMNFMKSYGDNMERLTLIKGGAEAERILLMRLHLLQGIVAFHQHKIEAAHQLLMLARDEYNLLEVNAESVVHLMEIGFSPREARLGLRACQGNVERAAEYIMKERQEKEEIKQKVKKDREDRRKAKKYGKCFNGESLNMHNVGMLVDMHYPMAAAAEALKQTNNDVALALEGHAHFLFLELKDSCIHQQLLQNHPELLDTPDTDDLLPVVLRDTDIAQLAALGFEPEIVKIALRKHRGSTTRAAEDLIKYNGILPYFSDESFSYEDSSGSSSDSSADKKRMEENEVLDQLVSDIPQDENEHLDTEMIEEKLFLESYLTQILTLQGS